MIRKTSNLIRRWLRHSLQLFVCVIALTLVTGCENVTSEATRTVPSNLRDNSIKQLHTLSWLGGKSHPVNQAFQIADPENVDLDVSPGGIVVTELVDGLPLASADIKAGDAIVRVAENWLPIKEDATLDFIKMVEDQIAAQKDEIELGYIRSGKYAVATLKTELESLDEDLPLAGKRFIDSSTAILEQLAALQQEDGSFSATSDDPEHQLMVTALCGLAFLSADESAKPLFADETEKVLSYLQSKLSEAEFTRELNPLTAAYVCSFLAECELSSNKDAWYETIGVLSFAFISSQHESGGWNVTESEAASDDEPEETDTDEQKSDSTETDTAEQSTPDPQPDAYAAFTTNMVLAAIGAMERAGISIENDLVESGVKFLHEQAKLRIPSTLDRRVKGLLSAGNVVALAALNLDQNDLQMREYLKIAQERAHDMFSSPALALPGMLHTSIASRQLGNESWLQQHNSTKCLLVAMHDDSGQHIPFPGVTSEPLEFELAVAGPAWNTAHVALLHSMQSQSLQRMLAIEAPENLLARDSSGKQLSKEEAANAKVIKLDLKGGDAEDLKRMIMEQLKARGMEVDESKMKIQTIDSKPKK